MKFNLMALSATLAAATFASPAAAVLSIPNVPVNPEDLLFHAVKVVAILWGLNLLIRLFVRFVRAISDRANLASHGRPAFANGTMMAPLSPLPKSAPSAEAIH